MDKWDIRFIKMSHVISEWSSCYKEGRYIGAVIVKDNRVLATGYNGSPKGVSHCSETGCLREKMKVPSGQRHELCRGLHAEQNAIIQAACMGASIEGAALYCTTQPCIICTKMIINAGIRRVVVKESYPDELAQEMMKEAGITVEIFGE